MAKKRKKPLTTEQRAMIQKGIDTAQLLLDNSKRMDFYLELQMPFALCEIPELKAIFAKVLRQFLPVVQEDLKQLLYVTDPNYQAPKAPKAPK